MTRVEKRAQKLRMQMGTWEMYINDRLRHKKGSRAVALEKELTNRILLPLAARLDAMLRPK